MNIKIGTRKSPMAVRQAEIVREKLRAGFPDDEFEIVKISTEGDIRKDMPLKSFGGKGVFIKEIEAALIKNEIDIAVHSAKDMPTQLPNGLKVGAVLERDWVEDVIVSSTDDCAAWKIIGTGSARREYQLREIYPNAEIKPIRGNVGTRIEKLKHGEYDAIMLSAASVQRMRLYEDSELCFLPFNPKEFIPAAGQGIIVVEAREGYAEKYLKILNDNVSSRMLSLEREFLNNVGGGCHDPAGAYAYIEGDECVMRTLLYRNGKKASLTLSGNADEPLGALLARQSIEITGGNSNER